MFVRAKRSGRYEYLQVVHNQRLEGRVRQRVVATLGRLDQLQEEGHIDALLSSCSRFAQKVAVIDAHKRGALPPVRTVKIGPALVFERLWRQPFIIRTQARGDAGKALQAAGDTLGPTVRTAQDKTARA